MPTLLTLLFAVAILSPEPLTHEPPSPPAHFEAAWETHSPDFIPAMLVKPEIIVEPEPESSSNVHRGMGSGNVEQWRNLVASQFPASQVDTALAIMACESGGNPAADNPRSSASGLFQILASLWAPYFGLTQADLYVPEINVYVAARIWEQDGWNAWSCYRKVQ